MVPVLYKNMEKQWVERFLTQGEVLLRPLTFFTNTGDEREDKLEGSRKLDFQANEPVRADFQNLTLGNVSIRSTSEKKTYIQVSPGANVQMEEVLPPAYSFSVSESEQPHLGGASYRIVRPEEFGHALLDALKKKGQPIVEYELRPVLYGSHKDPITSSSAFQSATDAIAAEGTMGGLFVKPSSYSREAEWRYIYMLEDDYTPGILLITEPLLVPFCERV